MPPAKKDKIAWEKWQAKEPELRQEVYEESDVDETIEEVMPASSILLSGVDFGMNPFNMISTPVGFFHSEDINRPDKQFDCWIGYTNFEITNQIKAEIERVEGVELLSILSRYRFFVGTGKLFTFNGWDGIRVKIENTLTGIPEEEEDMLCEETQGMIETIKTQVELEQHWAIFVFPNGEYDYVSSNIMDEDFNKKLSIFKLARDFSGGIIISSEEPHEQGEEQGVRRSSEK
jgi:hypothetical protein